MIASLLAALTLGAAVAGVNLTDRAEPKETVLAGLCGTTGFPGCP
ncbi:hypothetical protein [Nonomuraea antimicrobica]